MTDNGVKISGTIEVRAIDGNTKKVIVCSECRQVAAEFSEDTQVGRILVESSLDRHVMFSHNDHVFETYDPAKNIMEPGIVLRDRRIN